MNSSLIHPSNRSRERRFTAAGALLAGLVTSTLFQQPIRAGEVSESSDSGIPERISEKLGGETTIYDSTRHAFSRPIPDILPKHRTDFFVGNSFFNHNWVTAPASTEARDGLGPLYNVRSCSGCHFKDGRSRPPEPGSPMTIMLLRISIPGRGPHGAPIPHPVYGDQIQGRAVLDVPPEADVIVNYQSLSGTFPDGTPYTLRQPEYSLENPGYGAFVEPLLTSPRVAPIMIGLGLLETVPESLLAKNADPEDSDKDGISGRMNRVWDIRKQQMSFGRFGWKAEQPTVEQQVAGALAGDIGITSSLVPRENHMPSQEACLNQPSGGSPEISDRLFQAIVSYSKTLAVPSQRNAGDPEIQRGWKLFLNTGCADCHLPALRTGASREFPELSNQTIHPFTDLLLHDMGEGLADHRPTFAASGKEWRTPPLWGIGLIQTVNGHSFLLHDGRAENLIQAILWHGGEAQSSRDHFMAQNKTNRNALIKFLKSL